MSQNVSITQRFELIDASGNVVGLVVPKQEWDQLINGDAQRFQQPEAEWQKYLETIRQLTLERDQLREEVNALKKSLADSEEDRANTAAILEEMTAERDVYHRSLLPLLRDETLAFTDEEIVEALQNTLSFKEVIRQIELDLSGKD